MDKKPSGPGYSMGIRVAGYEEHYKVLEKAEEVLSQVIVPGYDFDLMSSGAVKRMRLSFDKKTLYIVIDFTGSDPSCYFCKFINWQVWNRILNDAASKLRGLGVEEVVFIDWATGAKIDY
ncbi:MAG: hypothetical protein F7C81_02390 [Desulfurococcales archaeon]|nr:hypothetical protein [Desulfurococcales archaeon]